MTAWETAGAVVAVAGGALALLGGLGAAAVKGGRLLRRVSRFLDQWLGHGHGTERVPGVIERVELLDRRSKAVEGQVFPNGGSSLRDAVEHVRGQVEAVRAELAAHLHAVEAVIDKEGKHG